MAHVSHHDEGQRSRGGRVLVDATDPLPACLVEVAEHMHVTSAKLPAAGALAKQEGRWIEDRFLSRGVDFSHSTQNKTLAVLLAYSKSLK